MKYYVSLIGLSYRGFHGLYPEEKIRGNSFEVDISLGFLVDHLPQKTKEMADYALLAGIAQRVMEGTARELMETLAQEMINDIEIHWPHVKEVDIRIRKKQPSLPGQPAWSEVRTLVKK